MNHKVPPAISYSTIDRSLDSNTTSIRITFYGLVDNATSPSSASSTAVSNSHPAHAICFIYANSASSRITFTNSLPTPPSTGVWKATQPSSHPTTLSSSSSNPPSTPHIREQYHTHTAVALHLRIHVLPSAPRISSFIPRLHDNGNPFTGRQTHLNLYRIRNWYI